VWIVHQFGMTHPAVKKNRAAANTIFPHACAAPFSTELVNRRFTAASLESTSLHTAAPVVVAVVDDCSGAKPEAADFDMGFR